MYAGGKLWALWRDEKSFHQQKFKFLCSPTYGLTNIQKILHQHTFSPTSLQPNSEVRNWFLWCLISYFWKKSYESFENAEFLNNNRLIQEDDMMNQLPLKICYDPNYKLETQNRHSFIIRDGWLNGKNNCNLWHILSRVFKLLQQCDTELTGHARH